MIERKDFLRTFIFFIVFLLIFSFYFLKSANALLYYYPIANQNFTSNASGWVYGEENDVNNMATGAWDPDSGRIDPGCYNFTIVDNSATAIAIVNQYINYTFSVNDTTNLVSAIAYASFRLTCNNGQLVYAKLNLITPSGALINLWTSQTWATTAALDTGWLNVTVDILKNLTTYGTGNYQLSLMVHTETSDNIATRDRTTCYHFLDDAGVQLAYLSKPPTWSNQQQSTSIVGVGAKVNLSAYWNDDQGLSYAWLATNETGVWENKTSIYLIRFNGALSGWSNFTWQNSSIPPGTKVAWRIYANDTDGNINVTDIMIFEVRPTYYLLVNLTFPNPSTINYIVQNSTFWINASVICKNADCGLIYAIPRYNASSPNPDTTISNSSNAIPFYVIGNVEQSCYLLQDQSCNVSWLVNATGDINTYWKVGVLFYNFLQNHTENATIEIIGCTVDFSLTFSTVDFGEVLPNTYGNPAIYNNFYYYNITINPGSCNLNLYINATDLVNNTFNYVINVGNLSYNTENNYLSARRLSYQEQLIAQDLFPNTVLTLFFWLDVPPTFFGKYYGKIFIKGTIA
jgi:hypothetical protein